MCSTSKVELVRAIGADEVIDYTREDFTDGTRRFDLILDAAGRRPLSQLRRALTPQGTLVIVGGEGGDRWLGGFRRQISPSGSRFTEQKLLGLISKERQQDLLTLKDLIEAGKLTPVIDRTYPLSEAPQAIRYLAQGHARGKVVLTVSNEGAHGLCGRGHGLRGELVVDGLQGGKSRDKAATGMSGNCQQELDRDCSGGWLVRDRQAHCVSGVIHAAAEPL